MLQTYLPSYHIDCLEYKHWWIKMRDLDISYHMWGLLLYFILRWIKIRPHLEIQVFKLARPDICARISGQWAAVQRALSSWPPSNPCLPQYAPAAPAPPGPDLPLLPPAQPCPLLLPPIPFPPLLLPPQLPSIVPSTSGKIGKIHRGILKGTTHGVSMIRHRG